MPTVATLDDLKDRHPAELTVTPKYAQTLLGDALDKIIDTFPTILDRLNADSTGQLRARVVRIQCAMASRVLLNPNGFLTETIDDYTYRRDAVVSTGKLYLSDDELDELTPVQSRRGGAFSIRPA